MEKVRAFIIGWVLVLGLIFTATLISLLSAPFLLVKKITKNKYFAYVLAAVLILALVYVGVIIFLPPLSNTNNKVQTVDIKRGLDVRAISQILYTKGIINGPKKFIFAAKLLGYDNQLKAGRYKIAPGRSNFAVLKILKEGRASSEKISFREGVTAREIASTLKKSIQIDSTRFMHLVEDSVFCRKLGIKAYSLEGYLFPETYDFYWGMSEEMIIKQMVGEFTKVFVDSLKERARELGFTPHEIVTLASIIEGEAVVDSERAIIAAVYHNRLRRGMPLQADPTIQYLIPDGPRRLLSRDLEIDSPYNTYMYSGLPPGPINNPGRKSIIAALYPAPVSYLYFVARGDGSHIFSRSLKEHLKAKREFDKIRRRVEAEKKKRPRTKRQGGRD